VPVGEFENGETGAYHAKVLLGTWQRPPAILGKLDMHALRKS